MLYDFQYSVLHRMTCTELLNETSGQVSLLLFRLFTKAKPRMSEGSYAAKHEGSHNYSSANNLQTATGESTKEESLPVYY